eukprot:TRINITY_DN26772_c0_g2_i1.p2 TRINITY_DN26772_c0_g2~~TRINITY_DN26772_c0_g2_i1.p2  ORF type:complete len:284 (-),score=100.95 TRINITY_DN26772_c0_g2_i1:97-876(-)
MLRSLVGSEMCIRDRLRWLAELVVCGIFTERMQLIRIFADTVKADLDDPDKRFTNLPIVVAFGKAYGHLFLPHAEDLMQNPVGPVDVFEPKEKEVLNRGLNKLFGSIVDALSESNKVLTKQEKANYKMMERGGEMNVDALNAYQELRAARDGLASLANSIAQVLALEIPAFEEEDEEEAVPAEAEEVAQDGDTEAEVEVIWDESEVRLFYGALPELRSLVPEVMFVDDPNAEASDTESGMFKALASDLLKCENLSLIHI